MSGHLSGEFEGELSILGVARWVLDVENYYLLHGGQCGGHKIWILHVIKICRDYKNWFGLEQVFVQS